MPSEKRNMIMAEVTSLIFRGAFQSLQCILHGLTSALFCDFLTAKSVGLVVAHDGFFLR